ncbi:Predicted PurR-regulated permease PerM [Clostridium sp. DSM 8431]|uniref:AI-2E family transporter n=1 Tax=Clostridium sp. DSM 8431 TaxID=1761781 RepID=UPI0008EDD137|nr:AI-2E family transporter [Clostridium sp. DSM 8431]SFU46469.1 Predicted PurR-regulated permease PerM [Clostridium sp. DSM 8431]
MKIDWNTKYTTIAVYTFLVICSVILFYLGVSQMGNVFGKLGYIVGVMQPIIMGFVLAYLFNFILRFYENRILKDKYLRKVKIKSKRGLGILLTYLTVFLIILLFMEFVFPQLVESIVGLVNDIPGYIDNLGTLINEVMEEINLSDNIQNTLNENWNDFVNYIIKFVTNLIPVLGSMLAGFASSIWNIVLGLIVSIYLLIDKEKFIGLFRKVIYAVFPLEHAKNILKLGQRSNETFGKFLSGKILDSFIIGVITFIVLAIFNMPYSLLVSIIVGITNIIPFFGPFIGAVPSVILILFVSPIKAAWFILIIIIIQQVDGNLIGPKILGNSIGISAFWILFSILVFAKLLGIVGMIIGVPLFAIVYALLKELVENKLRKKGLKTETKDYE